MTSLHHHKKTYLSDPLGGTEGTQAFPVSPRHLANVTAKAASILESEVRAKLAPAPEHITHFFNKEEKQQQSPLQAMKTSSYPCYSSYIPNLFPVNKPSTESRG